MSDGSDPYLYPGTDVLRNVPGLRKADQLAAFETAKTVSFMMRSDDNRIFIGQSGDIDPEIRTGEQIVFRATR